jgi:hypothetical protein
VCRIATKSYDWSSQLVTRQDRRGRTIGESGIIGRGGVKTAMGISRGVLRSLRYPVRSMWSEMFVRGQVLVCNPVLLFVRRCKSTNIDWKAGYGRVIGTSIAGIPRNAATSKGLASFCSGITREPRGGVGHGQEAE